MGYIHKYKHYFKLILGIVILLYLIKLIPPSLLAKQLYEADLSLLVFALLLNFPLLILRSARWRALLTGNLYKYDFTSAFISYSSAIPFGLITPGRIGELMRATDASKDIGIDVSDALPSVIIDRFLDIYILFFIILIAILFLPDQFPFIGDKFLRLTSSILSVAIILCSLLFLMRPKFQVKRLNKLTSKLTKIWLNIKSAFSRITRYHFFISNLYTVAAYLVFFIQCHLAAAAVELDISFLLIVLSVSIGAALSLVPVSVAGIGIREASVIGVLGATGVPDLISTAFALTMFMIFTFGGCLIGLVCWLVKINLRKKSGNT
jgi:glycosyltransferase 2 family protein